MSGIWPGRGSLLQNTSGRLLFEIQHADPDAGDGLLAPARGPLTDWAELVQVHDDRDIFQGQIDELPAIGIHRL